MNNNTVELSYNDQELVFTNLTDYEAQDLILWFQSIPLVFSEHGQQYSILLNGQLVTIEIIPMI